MHTEEPQSKAIVSYSNLDHFFFNPRGRVVMRWCHDKTGVGKPISTLRGPDDIGAHHLAVSAKCVCRKPAIGSQSVQSLPSDVSGVMSSKKYCVASNAESGSSCSWVISGREDFWNIRCGSWKPQVSHSFTFDQCYPQYVPRVTLDMTMLLFVYIL